MQFRINIKLLQNECFQLFLALIIHTISQIQGDSEYYLGVCSAFKIILLDLTIKNG